MDEYTLRLLDFDTIKNELSFLTLSEAGRKKLLSQEILKEKDDIEHLHDLVSAFKTCLVSGKSFPTLIFPDIIFFPLMKKEGSSLEGKDLAGLGTFILSSSRLKKYLNNFNGDNDPAVIKLQHLSKNIPDLTMVVKQIFSVLNRDGSIRENLPELKAIRGEIHKINREIEMITASYVSKNKQILQSDVPTQRDGRIVLALKADYRGKIQGIVHEVSGKGATLFIEPFDVVEKNNKLFFQKNIYKQAIHRILLDLTSIIKESYQDINDLIQKTAFIDTIYARARYSILYDCNRAQFKENEIYLKEARHPLLGKNAVPIDLKIDNETCIFIISGPNAGGKTVSLKTTGLFVLMNQFGMEIPVNKESGLKIFDKIFADIGDDQSIEQSLSTFSGHMKRISEIIKNATGSSLVLLDELGAGTDPEEGTALAMSILDHFLQENLKVVITTHHGTMKNYGYTRKGVLNASVSFDSDTLSPTYHIIPGIPGESHAFDIALQSNIKKKIIDKANAYLENEKTDITKIIKEITTRQREIQIRENIYNKNENELNKEKNKLALKELSLKKKELELKKEQYSEFNKYMKECGKTLENLVKELKEGEISRDKTKKVKSFLDSLSIKTQLESNSIEQLKNDLKKNINIEGNITIKPGIEVFVGKSRSRGVVLRQGKNNKWVVVTDTMKITVNEDELSPAPEDNKYRTYNGISIYTPSSENKPEFEIDLRGMRLDEAINTLKLQFDRALVYGLTEFGVIHGYGEGILQKGVHDYLDSCKNISEYHYAHPDSGGYGKTIVRLK